MAELSRLSPFGFLFGKSLNNLIHGIRKRNSPEELAEFLREVINECRDEVRSTNMGVKTTAILKLAYLEMLGFDMAWSGFHVVEVMASPHFQQKRIGYIAAMQSFRGDSELLMLVTNLLKMDLVNQSAATVGIALSGLATIVSPLLAADVADDIMRMLTHSKAYIRKKAVLALHNVVLQYPEVLGVALRRIADLLDGALQNPSDIDNVSVVGATVSVICELATHSSNIQDFLELTPQLYAVFNSSQHNWTIIKLLKIFKLFTLREPRLKARLLPTIRSMMSTSEATSIVYESASCIVQGGMVDQNDYQLAKEVITELQVAARSRDANLAFIFIGLLGDLASINAEFVPTELVWSTLMEQQTDPVTRKRVLRLTVLCVNDDTLFDFVTELMRQFLKAPTDDLAARLDIAMSIAEIVAVNNYEYVPDFEWLVKIFAEVAKTVVPRSLSRRLIDISVRVPDVDVRNSVSEMCRDWLVTASDANSVFSLRTKDSNKTSVLTEDDPQLFADTCWWIIGEFPSAKMLADPSSFVQSLSSTVSMQTSPAVATCVSKFVTKATNNDNQLLDSAIDFLTPLSYSPNFELQERSCEFLELLKLARSSPDQALPLLYNGLASLFMAYELTPIAPGSQLQITKPVDLDLDTPVKSANYSDDVVWSDSDDDDDDDDSMSFYDGQYRDAAMSVTSLESSSRGNTPQIITEDTIGDGNEEMKSKGQQDKETQLFNLANLVALQRERPLKKKVQIMKDSSPAINANTNTSVVSGAASVSSTSSSKLFKTGFSRDPSSLLEADPSVLIESDEPPPVKVKHKKKKKKAVS